VGWLPILSGIVGFLALYLPHYSIPAEYRMYLSVAVLAGLDAVVGGGRAIQEQSFKAKVFLSGFIMTVIIAVLLSAFGELLDAPIWYATGFVFTWRILTNVSVIRRNWLETEDIQIPRFPRFPKIRQDGSIPEAASSQPSASSNPK
jgi:small basic protein